MAAAPPRAWDWPIACVVSFSFFAVDSALDEFDCSTSPSLPGLSTRTEMFVLLGLICFDSALESAYCLLYAS